MIAILAALEPEAAPLRRGLVITQFSTVSGFRIAIGTYGKAQAIVCRTGMGRRAGDAAAAILGRYKIDALLAVGLAGALSSECRKGDVVICESVRLAGNSEEGGSAGGRKPPVIACDRRLFEAARQTAVAAGRNSCTGRSATVSDLAVVEQKSFLGQTTGCNIVEMESYWIAQEAVDRRIPFLAVRSIADAAGEAVPDVPGLIGPGGDLRVRYLLPYLIRQPRQLEAIWKMGRDARAAVGNLSRFLQAFVPALVEESGDRGPIVGNWRS